MTHENDEFFQRFSGTTHAYGLLLSPFGKILKTFTGSLDGTNSGIDFALKETFDFSDADPYHRQWVITKDGPIYQGLADDVLGKATASQDKDKLIWRYKQRLSLGKRGLLIDVTDIMVFLPDGITIGYSLMKKWGLPIGKLITTFAHDGPAASEAKTSHRA